jgi:hypothetical protein
MKSLKIDYLLLVLSVREKMIQTPNEGWWWWWLWQRFLGNIFEAVSVPSFCLLLPLPLFSHKHHHTTESGFILSSKMTHNFVNLWFSLLHLVLFRVTSHPGNGDGLESHLLCDCLRLLSQSLSSLTVFSTRWHMRRHESDSEHEV